MDTIKKLSDYAILTGQSQKFLGVPKTIDNDLARPHRPHAGIRQCGQIHWRHPRRKSFGMLRDLL